MKYLPILLLVTLTACTAKLTDQGAQVRIVDTATFDTSACKFIAAKRVTGKMGSTAAQQWTNDRTEARNQAYRHGANTVTFTNQYSGTFSSFVDAEMYHCPRG